MKQAGRIRALMKSVSAVSVEENGAGSNRPSAARTLENTRGSLEAPSTEKPHAEIMTEKRYANRRTKNAR